VIVYFRPPGKPFSQQQIELSMLRMIRKRWRAGVDREHHRDADERQEEL
jgi:hypothetical protein